MTKFYTVERIENGLSFVASDYNQRMNGTFSAIEWNTNDEEGIKFLSLSEAESVYDGAVALGEKQVSLETHYQ